MTSSFSSGSNLIYFLYFSVIPEFPNFFYDVVADDEVGHGLLELAVLLPELRHLAGGRLPRGVPREALLAGLDELLVPLVEGGLLYGVLAAELRNGGLGSECFHYDQYFLFCREDSPGLSADVLQVVFWGRFLVCLHNIKFKGLDYYENTILVLA